MFGKLGDLFKSQATRDEETQMTKKEQENRAAEERARAIKEGIMAKARKEREISDLEANNKMLTQKIDRNVRLFETKFDEQMARAQAFSHHRTSSEFRIALNGVQGFGTLLAHGRQIQVNLRTAEQEKVIIELKGIEKGIHRRLIEEAELLVGGSIENLTAEQAEVSRIEKEQTKGLIADVATDRGRYDPLPLGQFSDEEAMRLINGAAEAETAVEIEALKDLDADLRGFDHPLRGAN